MKVAPRPAAGPAGPATVKIRFANIFFGIITLLLSAILLWMALKPALPTGFSHDKADQPGAMLMAVKVYIVDGNGRPARGAIATLDDTQQVLADEQGIAYFEHAMIHDHQLMVVYRDEHYRQPIHLHESNANYVMLGLSLEIRRVALVIAGLEAALGLLLVLWPVARALRLRRLRPGGLAPARASGKMRLAAGWSALTVSLLLLGVVLAALFSGPLLSDSARVKAQVTSAALPVPTGLTVEEDDRNVVLWWNGGPLPNYASEPPGIMGYRVSWGLVGQPLGNVVVTAHRAIQLQPLVNGQMYQVQVQTVDTYGNLSAPSPLSTFTGRPERVNALRNQMTGFFDDFNQVAGPADELKWNQAYSTCNDQAYSSMFINTQSHAHSLVRTGFCDRGQSVARPRGVFDFTGRTGRIVFDFDGVHRRDIWYLDVIPATVLQDITGNVGGESSGYPANVLRIGQHDQVLELYYVGPDGMERSLVRSGADGQPQPLDAYNLKQIPNVRRKWEVQLSQNQISIFMNGRYVLGTAINLPYSRAQLQWNQFTYNTPKSNFPYVLGHWDNFGFDGPASPFQTHNYRTAGYGNTDFAPLTSPPVARQINIPDSLAGARAARLMFTQQMRGFTSYEPGPNDYVLVNGQRFGFGPVPRTANGGDWTVSSLRPYTQIVNLPLGLLRTGQNDLEFSFQKSGVGNVHIEVDFVRQQAPPYTPPHQVYPTQVIPVLPEVGPAVTLLKVGNTDLNISGKVYEAEAQRIYTVQGVVPIKFQVHHDLAMTAIGTNPGIGKVQVRLDKFVIYEVDLKGAPEAELIYNFDTTHHPSGLRELDVVAFNPSSSGGTIISIPDYFQSNTVAGDFYPVRLSLANPDPLISLNLANGSQIARTAPVGSSATAGFQVSNLASNGSTLYVSAPLLSGPGAAAFSISPQTAFTRTPGQVAQPVTIQCTPGAIATYTATLTYTTNDPRLPGFTFYLSCSGVAPVFTSSPAPGGSLAMAIRLNTPVTRVLSVNNIGSPGTVLNLSGATISGDTGGVFSLVPPVPTGLTQGGSAGTLTVKCIPLAGTTYTATLSFATNDPFRASVSYNLSCTGLTPRFSSDPAPDQTITLAARFGTPVTTSVQIYNTGGLGTLLNAAKPVLGGANPQVFTVSPADTPVTALPQGTGRQTYFIQCLPPAAGTYTADLTFSGIDDPARPTATYNLSCSGLTPLVVNQPLDSGNPALDGTFSWAKANFQPGNIIVFAPTLTGVKLQGTLTLGSATPLLIDGEDCTGGVPRITIEPDPANPFNGDGLVLAGNVQLRNLLIKGFSGRPVVAGGNGSNGSVGRNQLGQCLVVKK